MEYRLKYRDIPWYVAFFVLPGKILGTVFIKWPVAIVENWEHFMVSIGLTIILVFLLIVGVHYVTDGDVNLIDLTLRYLGVRSP